MRYRLLQYSVLGMALFAPLATQAQEPLATDSGATLTSSLLTLQSWAIAARGGDGEHLPTLKDDGDERLIAEERSKLFTRLSAYRRDCRADLRKANRDTKLATTLRCFRGLLSLELTTLQRWERFSGNLPGIPPSFAQSEASAVHAWAEAIGTVITALDADVYQAEEGLIDVRSRLTERYALPAEYARLRARRALDAGWLLVVLDGLNLLEESQPKALEATSCLAAALPPIETSAPGSMVELQALREGVARYEETAPVCLTKIKNVLKESIQARQNSGG